MERWKGKWRKEGWRRQGESDGDNEGWREMENVEESLGMCGGREWMKGRGLRVGGRNKKEKGRRGGEGS